VAGDGSQTRSVCYVDDLVEGIVRFMHSGHSGPMNIGNPDEFSVLALAEMVRELSGSGSPIKFVERPVDDPTVRQPDISLARAELGWEPQVPVRLGLRRTISWFRGHQELITAASNARGNGRLPGGTPAPEHGTPALPGGTPALPGGTPALPGGTPAPEQEQEQEPESSEQGLQRQPA
jgi:hypothetical protein